MAKDGQLIHKYKKMKNDKTLFLDTETYSDIDILNGVFAYARSAKLLFVTYALNDEPPKLWNVFEGGSIPKDLDSYLADKSIPIVIHNSIFDINILKVVGIIIPSDRVIDTMAIALAHSYPGKLSLLCDILDVDINKSKIDGKRFIKLFSKPTALGLENTIKQYWLDWDMFKEYALQDIVAMREVYYKLPLNNYFSAEKSIWILDQKINTRGFLIDTQLAQGALARIKIEQDLLSKKMTDITGGAIKSASQGKKTQEFLFSNCGLITDNLQRTTVDDLLNTDGLSDTAKEILSIRRDACRASTAKYKKLLQSVSPDNRLRGTLQYCGASRTGRWSGKIFQPQNLPRSTYKGAELESGIKSLRDNDLDLEGSMEMASSALRGCIIAPKDKKLVVSDLSNIEGRVLAWLAGEEWKVQAFRDFDKGIGHDLYRLAYAKSFDIPVESVTTEQRFIGKVQELALGYGGGVGALTAMCTSLGVDLESLAQKVLESDVGRSVKIRSANPKYNLSDNAYSVLEWIKYSWREAHPKTIKLWKNIESAITIALTYDCITNITDNLITFKQKDNLLIQLPSGRFLLYHNMGLSPNSSGNFVYYGMNLNKWGVLNTYAGKLCENIVQAIARDIMAYSLPRIEAHGYEIVLTVHDEVVCEAPDVERYNSEHLSTVLSMPHIWSKGLPLAAKGFEGYRYRKD